jgi:hypothetical protein
VTDLLTRQSKEHRFYDEDERTGTNDILWAEFLSPDLLRVHFGKDHSIQYKLSTGRIIQ